MAMGKEDPSELDKVVEEIYSLKAHWPKDFITKLWLQVASKPTTLVEAFSLEDSRPIRPIGAK